MTEREIGRTSPPELADLPADFWNEADVVVPPPTASNGARDSSVPRPDGRRERRSIGGIEHARHGGLTHRHVAFTHAAALAAAVLVSLSTWRFRKQLS